LSEPAGEEIMRSSGSSSSTGRLDGCRRKQPWRQEQATRYWTQVRLLGTPLTTPTTAEMPLPATRH
jgi:hypothetical protein